MSKYRHLSRTELVSAYVDRLSKPAAAVHTNVAPHPTRPGWSHDIAPSPEQMIQTQSDVVPA